MAEEVFIKFNIDGSGSIKTVDDIKKSVTGLDNSVDNTVGTLGELETRMESLNDELRATKIGTKRFKELQKEIQKTGSKIKDVELNMESLDFEGRLSAVGDIIGGISSGFAGFQGVMIATGIESEELEQSFRKLVGALAVAQAARDFGDMVSAVSKLGLATKITTAFQWLFNVALTANPIGLIIAGVAALVAGLVIFGGIIGDVAGTFKKFGDQILQVLRIAFFPLMLQIEAVIAALKWLGIIESDAARATREAAEERRAQRQAELKAIRKQAIAEAAAAKEKRRLLDRRSDAINKAFDFEIKKAQITGKAVNEIEELKLRHSRKTSKERIALLSEELKANLKAADAIRDEFESLDFLKVDLGKSFADAAEKNKDLIEENVSNIETALQDQVLNELKEEKAAEERAKQAAEKRKARLEQEAKDRADLLDSEIQKDIDREKFTEDMRLQRMADGLEKEKLLRQQKFDETIADLSEKGILTNELLTGLQTQLNEDLALIDQEAKDAELDRQIQFDIDTQALADEAASKKDAADKAAKDELAANEEKLKQARLQIADATVSGLSSLSKILAKDGEENERLAKASALIQVGIDTAKGISGAVAAGAGQPFPFNLAAMASGIASVLANIASAKSILSSVGASGGSSGGGVGASVGGGSIIDPIQSGSTLIPQPQAEVVVVESSIARVMNEVNVIEQTASAG